MRKNLLCFSLLTLFSWGVSFGQSFNERYFNETSYIFNDMEKITQSNLFSTYGHELGLGNDDDMIQTNNIVTKDGQFTTKYEQYHKGYRVQGAMMNVIGDKGIVKYANGFLVKNLDIDDVNLISEDDAIDEAIDFIGAEEYLWEVEYDGEDQEDKYDYYPKDLELIIVKKRGSELNDDPVNYQLCYRVKIFAIEPNSITDVYINANTGQVFTSDEGVDYDFSATGVVHTWHHGFQGNMRTRTCALCINYWLHDVERNIYTTTVDRNYWYKGRFSKDRNNVWGENQNEGILTRTPASAHWAAQKAWDYYFYKHGRWGSDYQGKKLHIKTHYPSHNAMFDRENNNDVIYISNDGLHPDAPNYGDFGYSLASLDVIGHEYTHGMIRASSDLGVNSNYFESRALNEGFADIFGVVIHNYALGYHNWKVGAYNLLQTRHLDNPHNDTPNPSPARYLEPGYWNDSHDNYRHNAGGVVRKWFYLIANGETFGGETVSPLGLETATKIAYITFNWWLWSNVTYPQMANQAVEATIAHYGHCSNEHKQVVKALRAVGFNVQVPFCYNINIRGPEVIDIESTSTESINWTANLNDIDDGNGIYQWHYPNDWQVSIKGNQLTLNDYTSTASQQLAVTYTDSKNNTYSDTIVVHFSDEEWQMTDNYPSQALNSTINEFNNSKSFILSPNPASDKVTLDFGVFEDEIKIEIYDLNGKLISTYYTQESEISIDISSFSAGLYIIKAIIGGKVFNEKLSIIK